MYSVLRADRQPVSRGGGILQNPPAPRQPMLTKHVTLTGSPILFAASCVSLPWDLASPDPEEEGSLLQQIRQFHSQTPRDLHSKHQPN